MAHAIFSPTQQVKKISFNRLFLKLFFGLQLPLWLKQNEFWINMFAYSHAMINPIIYITFNANFKKAFKRFLCCSNELIPNEYSRNCEFTYKPLKFDGMNSSFCYFYVGNSICSARTMRKTFIYTFSPFPFPH